MLKVLLKKQLAEIYRSYYYDAKKNKPRSKAATTAYLILFAFLMVVVLGGIFTMMAFALCGPLTAAGMDWLYFALTGLLAVFLGVFGSVFNTYAGLYLAKDNDLLLSMPIPVHTIMTARLLGVYLMGVMYAGVVILPAVIVYWIIAPAGAGAIFGGILLLLLISVFVLTLSCALGWVVAKISQKLKNKSFITVFISLVFFGAYYFFYFKAQELIADLVEHAAEYGEKIKGAAYPVYLFGRVGVGDPVAMLLVSAAVLLLFGLMWFLISRSFLKIATSSGKTEKRVYKETVAKQKGVAAALLAKEFGRFTSSPNYMLNCGMGILFLPVCGVLLLINRGFLHSFMEEAVSAFGMQRDLIPILLCAAVCLLASMNDMATPSVSLEGKNLWLMQSLPVKPWQVLHAKLSVQLLLTGIPTLFCAICIAVVCPFTVVQFLVAVLSLMLFVLFSALFGLFLGLKMPNLSWTSEITPIKQSGSVLLALLIGPVYALLLCGGFLLLQAGGISLGFSAYMGIFSLITLGISGILYGWLKKKGCIEFSQL